MSQVADASRPVVANQRVALSQVAAVNLAVAASRHVVAAMDAVAVVVVVAQFAASNVAKDLCVASAGYDGPSAGLVALVAMASFIGASGITIRHAAATLAIAMGSIRALQATVAPQVHVAVNNRVVLSLAAGRPPAVVLRRLPMCLQWQMALVCDSDRADAGYCEQG